MISAAFLIELKQKKLHKKRESLSEVFEGKCFIVDVKIARVYGSDDEKSVDFEYFTMRKRFERKILALRQISVGAVQH
jgi:hypothetical protein